MVPHPYTPRQFTVIYSGINNKMELEALKDRCIRLCIERGALLHGDFTLNSGVKSNVFFNSGILCDAESFSALVDLIVEVLVTSGLEFDVLIGLPYKGIPLAGAICMKYWERTGKLVSFGYHRKEIKDHGEGSMFVGAERIYAPGMRVVVIDDVLTSGKALFKGLDMIEPLGVKVVGVVVILNRELNYGTVAKALSERGINKLCQAFTLSELQQRGEK